VTGDKTDTFFDIGDTLDTSRQRHFQGGDHPVEIGEVERRERAVAGLRLIQADAACVFAHISFAHDLQAVRIESVESGRALLEGVDHNEMLEESVARNKPISGRRARARGQDPLDRRTRKRIAQHPASRATPEDDLLDRPCIRAGRRGL